MEIKKIGAGSEGVFFVGGDAVFRGENGGAKAHPLGAG